MKSTHNRLPFNLRTSLLTLAITCASAGMLTSTGQLHAALDSPPGELPPQADARHTETPFNHPLLNAAAQGFTVDDLENGRIGYEAWRYTGPDGKRHHGQRAVRIQPAQDAAAIEKETSTRLTTITVYPDPYEGPDLSVKEPAVDAVRAAAPATTIRFNPALLNPTAEKSALSAQRSNARKEGPDDSTDAVIRFRRPPFDNIQLALDKAVLQGRISSAKAYRRLHQKLLKKRQRLMARYMKQKLRALHKAGIRINRYSNLSASASVSFNPAQLSQLASAATLHKAGQDGRIALPAGTSPLLAIEALHSIEPVQTVSPDSLDSLTIARGIQADQMFDRNIVGYSSNGGRERVAVIEVANGLDDAGHPGFTDYSNGWNRVVSQINCATGSCLTDSDISSTTLPSPGHALAVSGIVIGDLTDGQDSNHSTSTARAERSGMAREAKMNLIYAPDGVRGLQYVENWASYFAITNNSWSATNPDCTGQSDNDVAANAVYEAGVAVVATAGNKGNSSSDCTLGTPGTAIGSFAVGGYTNSGDISSGTVDDSRNGTIYNVSSRGGDDSGRSGVDITAPACLRYGYDNSDSYNYQGCGTSFAAPTVTGVALNFISWWKAAGYSSAIEQPGILYSNLLLMGDGQKHNPDPADQYREHGFDSLWGAGRLKTRLWDSTGMDSQYGWLTGSRCIGNSETLYIERSAQPVIGSDVDTMKAVIWWYDRRHENGQAIDDIDLSIERRNSNGSWSTRRVSSSGSDNKERVILHDFSGINAARHRLKLHGYDVTADAEGCGSNKMKVYFAWYYEDSDRDDSDGPGWNSSTLIGIEPQPED